MLYSYVLHVKAHTYTYGIRKDRSAMRYGLFFFTMYLRGSSFDEMRGVTNFWKKTYVVYGD